MLEKLPCVILCGGKSSRMGSNKALLDFVSVPLVQYMHEKMQKYFREVYLVAKDDVPFRGFSYHFIQEQSQIYAPLVGIQASLERMERAFFLSVDTPFIGFKEIQALKEKADNEQILYAKTPYRSHFLCGIYHRSILPIVKNMIKEGDFRLSHLIERSNSKFVEFDDDEAFSNLNTPQDYQKALERMKKYGW